MLTWQRHPGGTQSIGESKVGSMAILVICYPKRAYGSDGESKVTGAGKIGVLSFGIHQWLLIFTNGDFQNKVAFSPLIHTHFETSKLIMALGKPHSQYHFLKVSHLTHCNVSLVWFTLTMVFIHAEFSMPQVRTCCYVQFRFAPS